MLKKQYMFRWSFVILLLVLLVILIKVDMAQGENGDSAGLVINEVISDNSYGIQDIGGNYCDWVEIYNNSDEAIELEGYGLSTDLDEPLSWTFPDIKLEAKGYLLVRCSGVSEIEELEYLSTDFKISRKGEFLVLANKEGEVLDSVEVPKLKENLSFGRAYDGEEFAILTKDTPAAKNEVSVLKYVQKEADLAEVEFSHGAGFYDKEFELELSTEDEDAVIYYTLDGSIPTTNSDIYIGPISIKDRSEEPNRLTGIETAREKYSSLYHKFGENLVYKGTVVRARTFKNGVLSSETSTNTYFIEPDYTLPVVSLTTDEKNLFDYEDGIYVEGYYYDKSMRETGFKAREGWQANYSQRGSEWEREAHVELFEVDGSLGFSEDVDIAIHGGATREDPVKSIIVRANKKYNETGKISYDFFGWGESSNTDFKAFILRTSGNDSRYALFRDALMQSLVESTSLDTQDYRPSILFINGEYWGIHNIREKENEYYIEQHYGIPKENVNIVEPNHLDTENPGSVEFEEFMEFVEQNDMSIEENYRYVESKIDVDNFIDYMVAQLYFDNTDSMKNNIKIWRSTVVDESKPCCDGRWRWLLYDTDIGFGLYKTGEKIYNYNTMEEFINEKCKTLDRIAVPFRDLLKNEEFKSKFLARFDLYMDTIFSTEVVKEQINSMASVIEPEIAEHKNRWDADFTLLGKIYSRFLNGEVKDRIKINFYEEVDKMLMFAEKRPAYIKKYVYEYFEKN